MAFGIPDTKSIRQEIKPFLNLLERIAVAVERIADAVDKTR